MTTPNDQGPAEAGPIVDFDSMPEEFFDRIIDGAQRQMFGTDNVGFCLACKEEADGCEPDAREYDSSPCGEREVYGASEILMMGGA
jgi:hypothetical protein